MQWWTNCLKSLKSAFGSVVVSSYDFGYGTKNILVQKGYNNFVYRL